MKNPSSQSDSRKERRWLWAFLGILFIGAGYIVLLPAGDRDAITVSSTPVGEIHTNGEHWVIFRFDAPRSRAVMVQQVLAVAEDGILAPGATRAGSFPDPSRPVYERLEAGTSKLFKVRRIGGGDWRARFDIMVPLTFGDQWRNRITASWREKSFTPWSRTYLESGRHFIMSELVKTTEKVAAPSPEHSALFPSSFLPF